MGHNPKTFAGSPPAAAALALIAEAEAAGFRADRRDALWTRLHHPRKGLGGPILIVHHDGVYFLTRIGYPWERCETTRDVERARQYLTNQR